MKEKWRLLETGLNNAYRNMAIDRAILVENSKGNIPPTVRFYRWGPPAISIGYFQSLNEEVDLLKCKEFKVDYVRRITGGGSVFHENELTYSIVIPESHPLISKKIIESYKKICGALVKGFSYLNIESEFKPINDIISNGKKISGNAQTRKFKTVLQHGTILIDVDVEKMFSLLRVPNEKIKDKLISDVKERVTSINILSDKKVTYFEVFKAMKKGFEDEFKVELDNSDLTDREIFLADKFEKEIFRSNDWNNKR